MRYALAMEDISANDDEAAARGFVDLMARDPTYVPTYLQAGKTLERLGRHQQAREVLQRGIEIARGQNEHHAADEMQEFLTEEMSPNG